MIVRKNHRSCDEVPSEVTAIETFIRELGIGCDASSIWTGEFVIHTYEPSDGFQIIVGGGKLEIIKHGQYPSLGDQKHWEYKVILFLSEPDCLDQLPRILSGEHYDESNPQRNTSH